MERRLTCSNYFIILEKTIFKRAHQKSKCLCSGSPRRHILGCGISPDRAGIKLLMVLLTTKNICLIEKSENDFSLHTQIMS